MGRKLYIVFTFRPRFLIARALALFTTTRAERKAGESISHVSLLYDAIEAPDVPLIAHSTKWKFGSGVQLSNYNVWRAKTRSSVVAVFELPGEDWSLGPVMHRINARYDLANWVGHLFVIVARWFGRRGSLSNRFGRAEDEVCSELVVDTVREQSADTPTIRDVQALLADLDPELVTAPDLYRRMKAHPATFTRIQ